MVASCLTRQQGADGDALQLVVQFTSTGDKKQVKSFHVLCSCFLVVAMYQKRYFCLLDIGANLIDMHMLVQSMVNT
jgi:hypothetical protein